MKITKIFSLQPYQSNLRTGQTLRWIISAGFVIFMMALTEGFIWGNLFNFYFEDSLSTIYQLLLGFFIGSFIFLLLWIIDSSFIVLDTSKNPIEENKWYKPTKHNISFMIGVIGRILVIGISLYITIPAITKLSIKEDISKIIEDENKKLISTLHTKTSKKYDDKITAIENTIKTRRKDLELETGGKGVSGNYGDGPVAGVIKDELKSYKDEIKQLKKDKETELNLLNTLPKDKISKKYGIVFKEKTAGEIEKIVSKLEKNENYLKVEKISRAYVILLFIALLLLKFFAPRSVKIYYNEELQDLYLMYKYNQINPTYLVDLQSITANSNDNNVTPYVFYNFWKAYVQKRYDFINLEKKDKKYKELDGKLTKLKKQKIDIENEIKPIEKDYLDLSNEISDFKSNLFDKNAEKESLTFEITEINSRITLINNNNSEDISSEYLITLSKKKNDFEARLAITKKEIQKIKGDIESINRRMELEENRLNLSKSELSLLHQNIEDLNILKQKLRKGYLNELDNDIEIDDD